MRGSTTGIKIVNLFAGSDSDYAVLKEYYQQAIREGLRQFLIIGYVSGSFGSFTEFRILFNLRKRAVITAQLSVILKDGETGALGQVVQWTCGMEKFFSWYRSNLGLSVHAALTKFTLEIIRREDIKFPLRLTL